MFNLLTSFATTFLVVRTVTYAPARPGARWARSGTCASGRRHIHHYVPGIVIALVSGAAGDRHA